MAIALVYRNAPKTCKVINTVITVVEHILSKFVSFSVWFDVRT